VEEEAYAKAEAQAAKDEGQVKILQFVQWFNN